MRRLLLPVAVLFLLSSCRFLGGERISGNGNIVTADRSVSSFNSVEAGGAVEVHVKQGNNAVRVETDENLLEFLEVFTDGNTLIVRQKKGYNLNPTKAVMVYVSAPEFKNLEVSGASKLFSDAPITGNELELGVSGASEITMEVKTSKLQADLSGASSLFLKGSSTEFSTQGSGASKIKCMDLTTDETTLDISGATEAEVNANKKLNIEASGASNVEYRGNADISQNSSGASSVKKVG